MDDIFQQTSFSFSLFLDKALLLPVHTEICKINIEY